MANEKIVYLMKNGIKYAYTNEAYWDKEKKQSRSKRRLIGHVDEKTGEIVPNRSYNKKKETENNKLDQKDSEKVILNKYQRYHFGATYLLNQIAKKTKVSDFLKELFPNDYKSLLSLAYYLVINPKSSMMNFELWARKTYPFIHHSLSSQRISELFKSITEDQRVNFFKKMVKYHGKNEYLVYDTTTISSYSNALSYVKYGHSKEDDDLPQFNLSLLYGEESKLPFSYRILPGNIPDVTTINWLLFHLEDIDVDKVKLVLDRGHHSHANILQFLASNQDFIIGSKTNLAYIKKAILSIQDKKEETDFLDSNSELYMHEVTLNNIYQTQSKNGYYPVKLFLYFDPRRNTEKRSSLDKKILSVKAKVNSNVELTESEEKIRKQFLIYDGDRYITNTEKVNETKQSFGWFALETNILNLTPAEALRNYRNKDLIEKTFSDIKGRLHMRRAYVSNEASLEGKYFVQFLALILLAYIKREMDVEGLFSEWTVSQILGELDLIDAYVSPENEMFVGEVLKKQVTVFEKLKIAPPK